MDEYSKQANDLKKDIAAAFDRLRVGKLNQDLNGLRIASQQPGFWDDSQAAQDVMKQIAKLENRVQPWLSLQKSINDVSELLELNDLSLQSELAAQLIQTAQSFAALKEELKFNGTYDDHDAIVSIYAGAGGTDARLWPWPLAKNRRLRAGSGPGSAPGVPIRRAGRPMYRHGYFPRTGARKGRRWLASIGLRGWTGTACRKGR